MLNQPSDFAVTIFTYCWSMIVPVGYQFLRGTLTYVLVFRISARTYWSNGDQLWLLQDDNIRCLGADGSWFVLFRFSTSPFQTCHKLRTEWSLAKFPSHTSALIQQRTLMMYLSYNDVIMLC